MKRNLILSVLIVGLYEIALMVYHAAQGPIDAKLALQSMDNSDAGWVVANSLGHNIGLGVVLVLLAAIWLPFLWKKKGKE